MEHNKKIRKTKEQQLSDLISDIWTTEPDSREESATIDAEFEEILTIAAQRQQKKRQYDQIWKYAAAILIVCSAAFGWYSYHENSEDSEQPAKMLTRITAPGEKLKITLPDSTIVYLSGATRLTWPTRFVQGQQRHVHLSGEGFFDVKRDTLSPFIVSSGNMQTQVLGTSFNISAYPADQVFSVGVKTGKVKVSAQNKQGLKELSLLSPGMKLIYNNHSNQYTINTEYPDDMNSWTTNRFVFREVNLGTMLSRLEKYYRVKFIIKSKQLADNQQFNAVFRNKSLTDIMKQIRMMSGDKIAYKINTDTLITLWREDSK